jgi:hypothetical protein
MIALGPCLCVSAQYSVTLSTTLALPASCVVPQAFVQLSLRLLLHQLQEHPTAVGWSTPAAVLVPALGQMLGYSSANIQVGMLLMHQDPTACLTADFPVRQAVPLRMLRWP